MSNKERVVQGTGARTTLKKPTTMEDFKQNRVTSSLSIRKEKTFQTVMKKRNLDKTQTPDNNNSNSMQFNSSNQGYFDSNNPQQAANSGIQYPTITYRQTSAFGTSYMSPSTESATGYTTHTVPIGNQAQVQVSFQDLCEKLVQSGQKPHLDETKPNVNFLPYYAQVIKNFDNPTEQFSATICIRRLLSRETGPPIDAVVQSGVIPILVRLLQEKNIRLQVEAAWAITNIASGTSEHVSAIINSEAVPALIQLLSIDNQELQDQCIWALGNITGDSPECRDAVLRRGILLPLLTIMSNILSGKVAVQAGSLMSNATWALSNLCRGRPRPDFKQLSDALPVLYELIRTAHVREKEILVDACWAVAYLADGEDTAIQKVLESGVAPLLLQLLDLKYGFSVLAPVLRGLGNIITGTFAQTQHILDLGILGPLTQLVSCHRKTIVKECCWVISNITAGHVTQARAVLQQQGLFPKLVTILRSADFESKKECVWAVHHAVGWKDPQIVKYIVDCQVIKPLVDLLDVNDVETICVVLDTIEIILEVGEQNLSPDFDSPDYIPEFEDAGLIDALDKLVDHKHESVFQKVNNLLEAYFTEEDDQDNNDNPNPNFNWQPQQNTQGNYHF